MSTTTDGRRCIGYAPHEETCEKVADTQELYCSRCNELRYAVLGEMAVDMAALFTRDRSYLTVKQ